LGYRDAGCLLLENEPLEIHLTKYLSKPRQDHRLIKKRTNPMLGFKSFETAVKTIQGIDTMHRIRKGQVKLKNLSASNNVQLFNQLFGLMA
jgi:IS6 family transposase